MNKITSQSSQIISLTTNPHYMVLSLRTVVIVGIDIAGQSGWSGFGWTTISLVFT